MAELAFESMLTEAREKERNNSRIWLRDMPRQTEEQQFLADSLQAWTDVREPAENRRDSLCKPEDVAAAVAKRIAYYQDPSGGAGGSGKVANKKFFIHAVFCQLRKSEKRKVRNVLYIHGIDNG
jgi:hypothetical protein